MDVYITSIHSPLVLVQPVSELGVRGHSAVMDGHRKVVVSVMVVVWYCDEIRICMCMIEQDQLWLFNEPPSAQTNKLEEAIIYLSYHIS